jgi:TRAP-type C4-dicarboxylate transport system permease small subunit
MQEVLARMFSVANRVITAVAGVALVLMVLVVVFDILGRSLGLWHVLSSVEQTTLYMMLLGFFGLVRCFADSGNIVVDVATHSLPKGIVRRIDAFWSVLATLVLLPLGYTSLKDGLVLHGYGQRSEVLGISPLVYHAIAAFGLAAAALVSLYVGIRLAFAREIAEPQEQSTTPIE